MHTAANAEPRPAASTRPPLPSRWVDLRNLYLILAGCVALLVLLPPEHEYPIIDDWIYAGSVRHQMDTGAFAMPPESQANLVGLTLWGTLWARLFGAGDSVHRRGSGSFTRIRPSLARRRGACQ